RSRALEMLGRDWCSTCFVLAITRCSKATCRRARSTHKVCGLSHGAKPGKLREIPQHETRVHVFAPGSPKTIPNRLPIFWQLSGAPHTPYSVDDRAVGSVYAEIR